MRPPSAYTHGAMHGALCAAKSETGGGLEPTVENRVFSTGAPGKTRHNLRCQQCNKMLAEQVTAPYRFTCPRCKTVSSA